MQRLILLSLLFFTTSFAFAQFNVTLSGSIDYDQRVNDIWGYTDDAGVEYALVGTNTGFSIVGLTEEGVPSELFFIPGQETTWRDVKTWDKYAYVVCDGCTEGMLVVDLSDLPNSIDHQMVTSTDFGILENAHNIWIDEFGYAYLCGSNLNGGAFVFDCFTDPYNPSFVSSLTDQYAHDIFVRDNKLYTSEIYAGQFCIYDIEDKSNPVLQGCQQTEFQFTHNAWLSDDNNYLFTTDERENASVGSYDVSDPTDIKELFQFRSLQTIGQGTIPHNVHVFNDYLIISYYTDGCIIVDASKPDNLVEVGNFDTYLNQSFGFNGVWGAYPFLPSSKILVTDRDNGLYVLTPNYQRAAFLEGTITDASSGQTINNASIEIIDFERSADTDAFGYYKLGYPEGGTVLVNVAAQTYESKNVSAELIQGELTILDVELTPLLPISFTGTVLDFDSQAPIPFAKYKFEDDNFTYEGEADENGVFTIPEIFEGNYNSYIGKWGHEELANQSNVVSINTNNEIYLLKKGYVDFFNLDHAWESGGESFSGAWELGIPIHYPFDGFNLNLDIVPSEDSPNDLGNSCFLTENNTDPPQGNIFGRVLLSSPAMEMSTWKNPTLSFDYWFFNTTSPLFGFPEIGTSFMEFSVSNGAETVDLFKISIDELGTVAWKEYKTALKGLIDISDEMKIHILVRTEIGDEITEGLVDNFKAWDAGLVSTNDPLAIELEVYPNPSNDYINIFGLETLSGNHEYSIFNSTGRIVKTGNLISQDQLIDLNALAKGMYLLRIEEKEKGESFTKKFTKL